MSVSDQGTFFTELGKAVTSKGAPASFGREGSPLPGAYNRVLALDGVRGVAILLVLLGHFYQGAWIKPQHPMLGKLLGRVITPAGYGVELFFVLSGLLITGILLDTKGRAGFFRKFYMRRMLRIFPLYYGALAIVFLLLPRVSRFDSGAHEIATHQVWLWTYLANWPTAYIWDNSHLFLLGHFWSLAVEEHFYLVWPTLVFLLTPRGILRACLLVIAVGVATRAASACLGDGAPALLQWTTLTKVDGLAIGAALAVCLRTPELAQLLPKGRRLSVWLGTSGALCIVLLMMPRRINPAMLGVFQETIIVAFFGLAVLLILRSSPSGLITRALESGFLVAFGKYSYGIYVIHGILRPALLRVFDSTKPPETWRTLLLFQSSYYVFATFVCFLLAFVSYHLFEKRCLRLKRHFEY